MTVHQTIESFRRWEAKTSYFAFIHRVDVHCNLA